MQHETKSTIEKLAWCNTCNKRTRHRVSGKRQGACLEHQASGLSKEQEKWQRQRAKEEQNPRLL